MLRPAEGGTGLPDPAFRALRDFIYEKSGMFFSDVKKYWIEDKLASRMRARNIRDASDYLMFLRYDPQGIAELQLLFDEVSVNETYFYRDQVQIEAIVQHVLPRLAARRKEAGESAVQVWSAGCASGEEPYGLQILMAERHSPMVPGVGVKIRASDLSETVLARARAGRYSEHSLRFVPPDVRTRHFTRDGSLFALAPRIMQAVQFERFNLNEIDRRPPWPALDLILCRNVLIYFDEAMRKKVVSAFYEMLRPGGFLFVGPAESLHHVTRSFKLLHFDRALGYLKD